MKTRILTAGCRRFREPIILNVEQAKHFGYETTIYDLGELNVEGAIKHEINSAEFKAKGRYHRVPGVGYAAKSLHKGDIVLDCLTKNPDDLVIYMDGDAIMTQDLNGIAEQMEGCDIGVTIRDPDDMQRSLSKRGEWRKFLGAINAGIIVFNNTEKARAFTEKWSSMIEESQSDQRALNDLVNPNMRQLRVGEVVNTPFGKVKCLDGRIYNYGYWPKEPSDKVRIIHAKGLRFRGSMHRIAAICRNEPVYPLRGYEPDFDGFYDDIGWEPHSISNVEAYYWWALIAKYQPDVVLESGVCRGRSTHVIAEACSFYNIPYHIALELKSDHKEYVEEKFKDYNVEFHYGKKSDEAVKDLQKKISKYRTLAIVDGPKGYNESMDLYQQLKNLNVVAIGVHDCSPPGGCEKAINDARNKYWHRASLSITNKKSNRGLEHYNEPILSDLRAAYENTKDHWSKKIGREMSYEDYCDFMGMVAICEIEGK